MLAEVTQFVGRNRHDRTVRSANAVIVFFVMLSLLSLVENTFLTA